MDLDPIPNYGEEDAKPAFSGRRVKRRLYRSGMNRLINADINGAINIVRKEIGDDWFLSHLESDKGGVDPPVSIRHIDTTLEGSPRAVETTSKRVAA